jgi:hypothetical protein
LPSAQTDSGQTASSLVATRRYFLIAVHGRVSALSMVVISLMMMFGSALSA